MSRHYDNWEKLVGAIFRREKDRQLAYCESFESTSSADLSSRFSFQISFAGDVHHSSPEVNVRAIKYEEIRQATRYRRPDNLLGEGSCSIVYKGWIDEHSLTASRPGLGTCVTFKFMQTKDKNFQETMWLEKISHLRHPNLVTPIGYCFDTDTPIFVYEFVHRGSLFNHLYDRRQEPLPWATRIKVAVGAARALNFLHGLETPVVNGNLTIKDIVLDLDFNAILSDVGLPKQVFITDGGFEIEGPYGIVKLIADEYSIYIAPEYIETGNLSTECDVYSFGVILVELVSGLRALDRKRPAREHNLIEWATPYLGNKRRLQQVMDIRLEGQYPHKQAWKVAQLALCCVSSNPRSRPTMADVVDVLQRL